MNKMIDKKILGRSAVLCRLLLLAALSLPSVGCAAKVSKQGRKSKHKKEVSAEREQQVAAKADGGMLNELLGKLIAQGEKLLGKPYRCTGIAPWPLDCSGYVSYLYNLLGVSIPHSSAALSTLAHKVKEPRPGDLVFFKGRNARSSRVGHVALVVENNNGELTIMHSTNSRGIIKHKLSSDAYFKSRYLFVGRLPWMKQMIEDHEECTVDRDGLEIHRQSKKKKSPVLNWQKPTPIAWLDLPKVECQPI